jgi:hypothetical protein
VRDPAEALAAARAAAAGAEPDDASWSMEDPALDTRRLLQWAIIHPGDARVYSTRRLGRPITWFKRLLVLMLRQYLNEVAAQQSRFNALVAAQLMRLDQRVTELERRQPETRAPE